MCVHESKCMFFCKLQAGENIARRIFTRGCLCAGKDWMRRNLLLIVFAMLTVTFAQVSWCLVSCTSFLGIFHFLCLWLCQPLTYMSEWNLRQSTHYANGVHFSVWVKSWNALHARISSFACWYRNSCFAIPLCTLFESMSFINSGFVVWTKILQYSIAEIILINLLCWPFRKRVSNSLFFF